MKTVAYLRISTGSQDLAHQKLAVLDYARQHRFAIDRFVEAQASSRKGRDLISERTKEGLAAARAQGRLLGRPKGSFGTSKLDGKEGEIRLLLAKEVSKASIAKIVGVSSTNLRHFIRTRKLASEASKGRGRQRHP